MTNQVYISWNRNKVFTVKLKLSTNSFPTAPVGTTTQQQSLEVTMEFRYDGLRKYCLSIIFYACFPELLPTSIFLKIFRCLTQSSWFLHGQKAPKLLLTVKLAPQHGKMLEEHLYLSGGSTLRDYVYHNYKICQRYCLLSVYGTNLDLLDRPISHFHRGILAIFRVEH
jgi:hypothetical protein